MLATRVLHWLASDEGMAAVAQLTAQGLSDEDARTAILATAEGLIAARESGPVLRPGITELLLAGSARSEEVVVALSVMRFVSAKTGAGPTTAYAVVTTALGPIAQYLASSAEGTHP